MIDRTGNGDHDLQIRYRTLSIHVENTKDEKVLKSTRKKKQESSQDPAQAIRSIDVHLLNVDEVYRRYSIAPQVGLEAASVERKAKLGKNLISSPPTQYWKKILNYVFGGFNFLMWIAFILTVLSYEPIGGSHPAAYNLGVAVLLILVIAISAGFYAWVDWHASRIMKSIKSLIAEEATVVRDGKQQTIPASDVVVGDLIRLSIGDRVPADIRLVNISSDIRFDRSLLTGESDMIPGSVDHTSDNALETRNLALTSTFVVQGNCTGICFAIGDKTVMGRLVAMSAETKLKLTTVQRELWHFTKIISSAALFSFVLSLIIWAAWLRKSYPGYLTASSAIINAIGCLTSFVPQGLPVCVALSLTIIAKRMAKRHVLVKNLATIETLGCMSILCSDKTGTLTMGKMSVQNIAFLDQEYAAEDIQKRLEIGDGSTPPTVKDLHMVARLCNGARFEEPSSEAESLEERAVKGDATDTAVLRFSESLPTLDSAALVDSHEKLFEIPFNSRNKWMLTVVRERKASEDPCTWIFVKGAPDILFPACTHFLDTEGHARYLDSNSRNNLQALQMRWSSQGQRVLALCRRSPSVASSKLDFTNTNPNTIEEVMYAELQDLTLVGLVGIRDPPRPDVKDAITIIRRAGVRVFMVTGDFKLTGVAIAQQIGIITQEKIDTLQDMRSSKYYDHFADLPHHAIKPTDDDPLRALVITGDDIVTLTDDDWDAIFGLYTEIVFARTTPEQKLRIVEEAKLRGDNTVAVTGDGVNDAPALKASDIGVVMGSGSDVAKDAASMVLLNNDISSIVDGIEMGRLVFDNLKKVIMYLLPAGNYSEFMPVFANFFLGMQLAMSSYLQVCFCITNDVVMSIALMYEKPEADLMLRKPRNARTDRLTDWRFFFQIYLFIGLMMWPSAMAMWFLYMEKQNLGFYDVILVFNKWTDGWKGYTMDELTHFVSVGQCCYYVALVFAQYGDLLAVRNRRVSILQSNPLWGPRRNLMIPVGMVLTAVIAVVNLYGKGLQDVFATAPIPGMFWGIPFAFGAGILMMDEIRKLIVRSYPKSFIAWLAW
ncbi:calcium ATPase transmembrane domain M-containing protein [Irpex rosettiformis]|uniref:Calcium ATPase transmembrane domain M-containing protein n=1 Tax=Irpex rosettiformis TaxID=378272 RepID=A0ACB8U3P6_9APHY|nr:calcium ATPase transmembrane domain M-containing protein [Irpex rosettiformis]